MIDIELAYRRVHAFLSERSVSQSPRILVLNDGEEWNVIIIHEPYPNEYFGTLAPKSNPHENHTGLWYVLEGRAQPCDEARDVLANDPRRRQYVIGRAATIQEALARAWANLKKEFPK